VTLLTNNLSKHFAERITALQGKRIGVVGDAMLDRFLWGDTDRISPEAPVPVIRTQRETLMPGGAANVANNIAALGGRAELVGFAAADEAGKKLRAVLRKAGVTSHLFNLSRRMTTEKTRIIARGQQIVRVDREVTASLNKREHRTLLHMVLKKLPEWDALVLSDYVKGVFDGALIAAIVRAAQKSHTPIIADLKPEHLLLARGVTIVAPNEHEALLATKTTSFSLAGKFLSKRLRSAVLITRGEHGMALFEKNKVRNFPAAAREVFDVAGAGDTVTAVLALALGSGASLPDAVDLANRAAGIVVGKVGVATVTPQELLRA